MSVQATRSCDQSPCPGPRICTICTNEPASGSTRKPRKNNRFTATIYCGNCRNVGDYEFRRGVILHADERHAMSERRHSTPDGYERRVRLEDPYRGRVVECKFCKCATALTIRERNGDVALGGAS